MTDQPKPHCRRCGRTVKPRWAIVGIDPELDRWPYVGPTCRKKWIADGTYTADDFVDTKPKVRK